MNWLVQLPVSSCLKTNDRLHEIFSSHPQMMHFKVSTIYDVFLNLLLTHVQIKELKTYKILFNDKLMIKCSIQIYIVTVVLLDLL